MHQYTPLLCFWQFCRTLAASAALSMPLRVLMVIFALTLSGCVGSPDPAPPAPSSAAAKLNPETDAVISQRIVVESGANWVSLFDDETLNGWRVHGGAHDFSVKGGVITGTAIAGEPNAFLVTEAVYSDFILEADFLSDGSMNSGIIFRADHDPEYREGRLFGYQADIDPSPRGWTGGLFEEALRGWLVPLEDGNPCKSSFKPKQWNTMRIEAVGTDLRIFLNGVPCARSTEDNLSKGVIGLQVHSVPPGSRMGKPGDWVSFRNIRILTDQPERFRLP